MPFPPVILDDLARAGSNIVIDALTSDAVEVRRVVQLWDKESGNVTIRNASRIPAVDLRRIAEALGPRVTFEE